MSKSAIAVIQARLSSTRLPRKVLADLAGKPMIQRIVDRARRCKLVEDVVVATSVENSDDDLVSYCESNGIAFHRGSLSNVLSRYVEVIDKYDCDYVVRITGDCPFIDPEFIDFQIRALGERDADFCLLNSKASLLEGQGVLSTKSLKYIYQRTKNSDDLEHVGSRFYAENHQQFKIVKINLPFWCLGDDYRITVDEKDDLDLISKIYFELGVDEMTNLIDVKKFLDSLRDVDLLNKNISDSSINIELKKAKSQCHFDYECSWQDFRI